MRGRNHRVAAPPPFKDQSKDPSMSGPILMIDARNCMYRAIYAGKNEERRRQENGQGAGRHYATIMLDMISKLITDYKPSSVQIFWDAPRSTVWRMKVFSGYKDRDKGNFIADITEDLVKTEQVVKQCLNHLNVYQFRKKMMEADDLIYAACKLQGNREIVIVSSDADMTQISYSFDYVRIYNADKSGEVPRPQLSPVLMKSLVGDPSDRIPGYHRVGPKTAQKLLACNKLLHQFLEEKGREIFNRNLLLIDLAVCPYLLHNLVYVGKVLGESPVFDREKLLALDKDHKIRGLFRDFVDVAVPFKKVPYQI